MPNSAKVLVSFSGMNTGSYPKPVLPLKNELKNLPPPLIAKYKKWLSLLCEPLEKWPESFFKTPPFLHPYGGSWVRQSLEHLPSNLKENLDWNRYKPYLHILEWHMLPESLLADHERVLADMSPDELKGFKKGFYFVQTQKNFMIYVTNYPDLIKYNVYKSSEFEKFLNHTPYQLHRHPQRENCLFLEGDLCWVMNDSFFQKKDRLFYQLYGTILSVFLSIIGFLIWTLFIQRKRAEGDRQLLVETLAHELRHPATSLKLSLETFRKEFERFSEPVQNEFMRMCGQLERLQKLINASNQYLQMKTDLTQPFNFNWQEVESINEYFLDLLEPYSDRITLQPLINDRSFIVDPYWLGMCVVNLVKNALIHGQPPVFVTLSNQDTALVIKVKDAGKGPDLPLKKLLKRKNRSSSKGMGLGLTLVYRIVRLMNGKLFYEALPQTSFMIILESRKNEKTAAH